MQVAERSGQAAAPVALSALARPPLSRRTILLPAGLLLLLAWGLRLWHLGGPSLWYDEGVTWWLASQRIPDLLNGLAIADFNPPLYPLGIHFWLVLAGQSEYALRFPSAACSMLLVPLCWVTARRCGAGRPGATVAATLAATSIFAVDYAQEARAYTAATALGLLSSFALLRLLAARRPHVARWWWAYVLATAAMLACHYAAILLLPAQVALVVARRPCRRQVAAVAAWLAAAVLYLPWLPELGRQLAAMRASPDFWSGSVSGWLAPERALAAIVAGPGAFAGRSRLVLAIGVALFALCALATVLARPGHRRQAAYPALLTAATLLEAAALTAVWPKFIDRYLLPAAPTAYVAVAVAIGILVRGCRSLRPPTLGRSLAAALSASAGLMCLVVVGRALWHAPIGSAEIKDGDTRAAVAAIVAQARPGDAIVLAQDTSPVFRYYYNGALGGEDTGWFPAASEFTAGDNLPALAAMLNRAAAGHQRLWLLLWHADFADPTGYLRNAVALAGQGVHVDYQAEGYDLQLFALLPDAHFSPNAAPLHPMSVRFGPHLTFLGDGLEQWDQPGDVPFVFHVWFRTDVPLDRDYQVVLRLERDGYVWQQATLRPAVYTYPAMHWRPGIDVPGRLELRAGAAVPPGDYHATLAVYDPVAGQDLSAVDARGGPIGTRVDLGFVRVLPPVHPEDAQVAPTQRLDSAVDAGLRLLGDSNLPITMEQGGTRDVTLFWQRTAGAAAAYTAQLEVVSGGQVLALTPLAPPAPGLGIDKWPAGATFEDIRTLHLPPRAPLGPAALQVRLRPAGGGPDVVVALGSLTITARPRDMTEPAVIPTRIGALFGGSAWLEGLALDTSAARPGGQVVVTLYWQCRATLDDNYKVFVHLLDATNAIGGRQHDGEPDDGAAPTSSWVPSQWITDRHVVPIPANTPPGSYRLELGLYRQAGSTFLRLPLTDGRDALIAGMVAIAAP